MKKNKNKWHVLRYFKALGSSSLQHTLQLAYMCVAWFSKFFSLLKLKQKSKTMEFSEPKDEKKEGVVEIPPNRELREEDFVTPNDDHIQKLLYSTYSARLELFKAIRDSCPEEEIEEFAKTGLKLKQKSKTMELSEPKDEKKEEVMEIPPNMEFSEKNFINRFTPNDDMPLMPLYSTYSARLESFKAIEDSCPGDEIKELAKTGFYLSGEVCWIWPPSELNSIQSYRTFCFCCGCSCAILLKYPRYQPVTHFLHCTFFTLPEDKQYIKKQIKVFRGVEDVDFDYVERLRAEIYPGQTLPDIRRTVPICETCKLNEVEVTCHPCFHDCCIWCAKRTSACPNCGKTYVALERRYVI